MGRCVRLGDLQICITTIDEAWSVDAVPAEVLAFLLRGEEPNE